MNLAEISKINAAYGIIADIPAKYKTAERDMATAFVFKEAYNNPLHTYNASDLVSELRISLITFVINKITENANYTMDRQVIQAHIDNTIGKSGFDAQVIVDYITEHYGSRADELSLEAIKQQVRLLRLVFQEDYEERIPDLNELVKKDTLTLRCFLNWTYHWDYNRFIPLVNAFEQYVRIELLNEKPSEVKAWQIERAYTYEESGLGVHKMGKSDIFESAQLYKNTTLRIRFKSTEYAERIGKAFIRDFYNVTTGAI